MLKDFKTFLKQYGLQNKVIGYKDIREVIETQGFKIIEFSHDFNNDYVEELLKSTGLHEASKTGKGFTYIGGENKIVFLLSNCSTSDKAYILYHEEGHIYNEHLFTSGAIHNTDVQKEKVANDFASDILKHNNFIKRKRTFITSGTSIASLGLVISCLYFLLNTTSNHNQTPPTETANSPIVTEEITETTTAESSTTTETSELIEATTNKTTVYITITGKKYHRSDCSAIKNSGTMEIELSEAIKLYEPCKLCRPE